MTKRLTLLLLLGACGDDPIHHLVDAPLVSRDAPVPDGRVGCTGQLGAFSDDFATGLARWTTAQTTPGLFTATAMGGVVHVAKVGTSLGGFQNIAIELDLAPVGGPIAGDFTLAIDFANAMIGPTGEDQVELHPTFADGAIFFAVYSNHGGAGPEVHVWDGSTVHSGFATTQTAGALQLQRTGAMLSATALGQPVYAAAVTTSALTGAALALNLQPGSDDAASVDFSKFRVTWTCL